MVRCKPFGCRNPTWPRMAMSHRLPVILVRGEVNMKTVLYADMPHRLPVVAVRGKEAEAAAAAAKAASTRGRLRGVQRSTSSAAWRTPPSGRTRRAMKGRNHVLGRLNEKHKPEYCPETALIGIIGVEPGIRWPNGKMNVHGNPLSLTLLRLPVLVARPPRLDGNPLSLTLHRLPVLVARPIHQGHHHVQRHPWQIHNQQPHTLDIRHLRLAWILSHLQRHPLQ